MAFKLSAAVVRPGPTIRLEAVERRGRENALRVYEVELKRDATLEELASGLRTLLERVEEDLV